MAKHTINGFVVYRTASYFEDNERAHWVRYDPRGSEHGDGVVFVAEHPIEVEVPDDFDPRPQQVAHLVAQKEKARAQFSVLCTEIDKRINSLLALEMAEAE